MSVPNALVLTLISRNYCHLCHEMERELAPMADEFGASVVVVDVDTDPELETRYGERVPVLLHEQNELCHYFLETGKVREYLGKIG